MPPEQNPKVEHSRQHEFIWRADESAPGLGCQEIAHLQEQTGIPGSLQQSDSQQARQAVEVKRKGQSLRVAEEDFPPAELDRPAEQPDSNKEGPGDLDSRRSKYKTVCLTQFEPGNPGAGEYKFKLEDLRNKIGKGGGDKFLAEEQKGTGKPSGAEPEQPAPEAEDEHQSAEP